MIARRRLRREQYKQLFTSIDGVTVFGAEGDEEDNVWLTSILVDKEVAGWSAADLSAALREDNIESRPLWKPMHLQPVFSASRSLVTGTSERLFSTGLTLPSGSVLSDNQFDRVLAAVHNYLGRR